MKRIVSLPIITLTVALVFLSSCQPAATTPTSTEVSDQVHASTSTTVPTELPATLPPPTQTATLEPSATATPALTFTLSSAERRLDGYNLGFTVPGISTNYRLVADGNNFTCSTDVNAPDLLFCYGPYLPMDNYFFIQFYDLDSGALVYESETIIPNAIFVPTMPAGDPRTWCPERGQNVVCENETVWSREPVPCYASTCYDACGYYYSIDTCVPGT